MTPGSGPTEPGTTVPGSSKPEGESQESGAHGDSGSDTGATRTAGK